MKTLLFAAVVVLSGCAANPSQTASDIKAGLSACMAATNQARMLAVEVPSTSNVVSDKLLVATVKIAGSSTVDHLVAVLSLPSRPPVAVFGRNDEVVAATLEVALRKLPAAPGRPAEPICFAGDTEFAPVLQQAADAANVKLIYSSASRSGAHTTRSRVNESEPSMTTSANILKP